MKTKMLTRIGSRRELKVIYILYTDDIPSAGYQQPLESETKADDAFSHFQTKYLLPKYIFGVLRVELLNIVDS